MRIPIVALVVFLLAGCASPDWWGEIGAEVPQEIHAAIDAGPDRYATLEAGRGRYYVPVGRLDAERETLERALLAAPIRAPRFPEPVTMEGPYFVEGSVIIRERTQVLEYDTPRGTLTIARTRYLYHLDLQDPEDETHHFLVRFEPTPEVDDAWDRLVRAADAVAVSPPSTVFEGTPPEGTD